MGRQCPAGQQHDRNVDALPVQFDQQVDAGNLQQDDDDIDIDGGTECAEQRATIAETLDDEALLRQFVGQGLAMDWVAVEEKDANGVRLADGGKQRGRGCFQGYDILFKSGDHLKSLPLVSLSDSSNWKREPLAPGLIGIFAK